MKTILALFISVMATTAHAESISETRSKSIVRILSTPMLKELFKSEDGSMGYLKSIKHVDSLTTDNSDSFELILSASQNNSTQVDCNIMARVERSKKGTVSFETPQCAVSQIIPQTNTVCKNPSPTGCKD